MLIFNGANNVFVLGGLGTRRGTPSFELSSEVNRIFTFVEGNLNTHLKANTTKLKYRTQIALKLKLFERIDLRGRQIQWWRTTSRENTVYEDSILAVARQVELS